MSSFKRRLIKEELAKAKYTLLEPKIKLAKQNISEAKHYIANKHLLTEFFAGAERRNPGGISNIPYAPWSGAVNEKNEKTLINICWPGVEHKQYRKNPGLIKTLREEDEDKYERLVSFGGWWHPATASNEVVWEMDVRLQEVTISYPEDVEANTADEKKIGKGTIEVSKPKNLGNDRLWFYADGTVYSTNTLFRLGYEATKHDTYGDTITLYKHKNGASSKQKFQHFWEDDTIAGIVFTKDGQRPALQIGKSKEKYAKRAQHETLDLLNTVLDWAGFIPGVGDALDVINGVIYYYRCKVLKEDKWLDVLFSAIAAIPFIGSNISIGFKTAARSAKGNKLAFQIRHMFKSPSKKATAEAERLWELLLDEKVLTPKQLQLIAKKQYIKGLGNMLRRSKKPVSDVIGTAHVKQFDEFADKLDELQKGLSNIAGISRGQGKKGDLTVDFFKQVSKESPGKSLSFVGKIQGKINKGFFGRIKGIKGYPAQEVNRMANMMQQGFRKSMKGSPDKIATLSRSMGNSGEFYRDMQQMARSFDNIPPKQLAEFQSELAETIRKSSEINPSKLKQVKQTKTSMMRDMFGMSNVGKQKQYTKTISDVPYGKGDDFAKAQKGKNKFSKRDMLTPEQADEMAKNMTNPDWWYKQRRNPVTAEQYNAFFGSMQKMGKKGENYDGFKNLYGNYGDVVTKRAVDDNNIFFNMYKMNGTANLRTLFYSGDDFAKALKRGDVPNIVKQLNTRMTKWVDIIYNEHVDLREELGWESRDEAQAAVIPLIKMAVYDGLSDNAKQDIKDVFDMAGGAADIMGTTAKMGMNGLSTMMGGLTPTHADFVDYNPADETGNMSKYGELGVDDFEVS